MLVLLRVADLVPQLGTLAGNCLEHFFHDFIPSGCKKYKLKCLRADSSNSSGAHMPRFPKTECSTFTYVTLEEIGGFQWGVYYKPKHPNQASFDSFMIIGSDLVIFQITFSRKHPIKIQGLAKLLARVRVYQIRNSFLVFVVPENHFQYFKREQSLLDVDGKLAKKLPDEVRSLRQYVLGIGEEEILESYRFQSLEVASAYNAKKSLESS